MRWARAYVRKLICHIFKGHSWIVIRFPPEHPIAMYIQGELWRCENCGESRGNLHITDGT
jgi:hypothetical protein